MPVIRNPGSNIGDPNTRRYLNNLISQLNQSQSQITSIASEIQKLSAAAPQSSPSTIRNALQANGSAPLNVTNLLGILAQPQISGVPSVTSLPPLSSPQSQDGALVSYKGSLYRFDGSVSPGKWKVLISAVIEDTRIKRQTNYPAANYPIGTEFFETDTKLTYIIALGTSGAPTWTYQSGIYSVNQSSLGGFKSTLGAPDADIGLLVNVVDYFHRLYWGGVSFQFDFGDPQSGFISLFPSAPSGGGWVNCMGGGSFTYLKNDGTISTQALLAAPDPSFIQIGSVAANNPAQAPTTTPDGGTQNDIGSTMVTQGVAGGTVVTVASHPHAHQISVNSDGKPAGFALLPYFRI